MGVHSGSWVHRHFRSDRPFRWVANLGGSTGRALRGPADNTVDVILVELLSAFEKIQFHHEAQAGDLSGL